MIKKDTMFVSFFIFSLPIADKLTRNLNKKMPPQEKSQ